MRVAVNDKYGAYTILELQPKHALVKCECGEEKTVRRDSLSKLTKECPHNKEHSKVVPGYKSGLLTVVKVIEGFGCQAKWDCICDCGNKTTVMAASLASNAIKSCGCGRRHIKKRR